MSSVRMWAMSWPKPLSTRVKVVWYGVSQHPVVAGVAASLEVVEQRVHQVGGHRLEPHDAVVFAQADRARLRVEVAAAQGECVAAATCRLDVQQRRDQVAG